MPARLTRPAPSFAPGRGLLRNDHFEVAYATNDIDRALEVFRDRFGIAEFRRLEGALPQGGHIRIELAWAGGVMYELLTASGAGSDVYVERLPTDRFAIQHHHLGYLIHDAEEWRALEDEIARAGWTVRVNANVEGFMRQIFVEAPEIGHLLEYLWPEPAGVDFFDSVPGN
jgi:extradiol dioxygenase family protein